MRRIMHPLRRAEAALTVRAFHRPRTPLTAFLAAFLLAAAPANAWDLVMSVDDVTGPTAGAGTFEVLLANTNLPGGSTFDVASFTFEILVPSNSGVHFTSATTATSAAPYIFFGTGGASVDPSFQLSVDGFPNTDVSASDTEFSFPSIPVGPGQTFGLGRISYSVDPQAPTGDVPISFIPSGTSLSDGLGNPIVFATDSRNGVIHIAANAVPEPSTLRITASAIAFAILAHVLRARVRLPCPPPWTSPSTVCVRSSRPWRQAAGSPLESLRTKT